MMERLLQRTLYKLLNILKRSKAAYILLPRQVQEDARVIGQDIDHYYIKKMEYSGLLLVIGLLTAIAYAVWYQYYSFTEVQEIVRPEVYQETEQLLLEAGKESYLLKISPQALTKEDADSLIQELTESLDGYILAQNKSLDHITSQLFLPDYIEGYPFDIYWQSDKEQIIDSGGDVNRYGLTEDEIVILTASFYYKEWMWERQIPVIVEKEQLTEEELYRRNLEQLLIEEEAKQRYSTSFTLPQKMKDELITYGIQKKDNSLILLAALLFMASAAVWLGLDNDLKRERNKRREAFTKEYAPFLSNLSMYISAGATLQMAMNLCIEGYIARNPEEHIFSNALTLFQRDVQNGYGFSAAMERFATYTDDVNYRKLAGILNQSIVNGSKGLAAILEEEVGKVQEEKRRRIKVKGEQVSTALLAPMMLQLGIVIALIMIPALSNMQF